MESLRSSAISDLRSAAQKCAQAGLLSEFIELAATEGDLLRFYPCEGDIYDDIFLNCAVCSQGDNLRISLRRPKKTSRQYYLELTYQYEWRHVSLWERIKQGTQQLVSICLGKTLDQSILIGHGQALSNLRDFFRRMDRQEILTSSTDESTEGTESRND